MTSSILPDYLTLKEVATLLGVSERRVRQLAEAGKIAGKDKLFLRKDVEALHKDRTDQVPRTFVATRTEAAIALRAFDLFKAGRTLRDVMAELQLTPQRVRALHREYVTPLGGRSPQSEDQKNREEDEFIKQFQQDQAARRAKADRDHQDRMIEIEDLARLRKEKGKR